MNFGDPIADQQLRLGTGTKQPSISIIEIVEKRARVDAPQGAIDLKIIPRESLLEMPGIHHLEHLALVTLLNAGLHHLLELTPGQTGLHLPGLEEGSRSRSR